MLPGLVVGSVGWLSWGLWPGLLSPRFFCVPVWLSSVGVLCCAVSPRALPLRSSRAWSVSAFGFGVCFRFFIWHQMLVRGSFFLERISVLHLFSDVSCTFFWISFSFIWLQFIWHSCISDVVHCFLICCNDLSTTSFEKSKLSCSETRL